MPHKTVITGYSCASKIKRPPRKNEGRQEGACIKIKESHKKCGFDE
jgi:hypothetical protein